MSCLAALERDLGMDGVAVHHTLVENICISLSRSRGTLVVDQLSCPKSLMKILLIAMD